MSKAYIISESDMELLHMQLEKAFRDRAQEVDEDWNTSRPPRQPETVYDQYKRVNLVVRRWVSETAS